MEQFGESYKGQRRGDASFRMEGSGRYTFQNGDVYVGSFHDGAFHGKGVLLFAGGQGRFEGEWKNGNMLRGEYVFEDGLVHKEKEWTYTKEPDRRLFSEQGTGIAGAK